MTHAAHAIQPLIERQRQRLQALRDDAENLARAVADEAWDRFEVDIEEQVGDSIVNDLIKVYGLGLTSALWDRFENACTQLVFSRFERMGKELNAALAENGVDQIDTARLDLMGMFKSLRVRKFAEQAIDEAIERAKPGVGKQISIFLGSLLRDEDEEMDALDRDMAENAERLKRELYGLRETLKARMTEDAHSIINASRLSYLASLDALEDKIV